MYAGKERRNRVVALMLAIVLLASVVLALLATVVQASPARAAAGVSAVPLALPAHAKLVSVAPEDGAALDHAPAQVQLTFDDVVGTEFAQIRLTHDGMPVETSAPVVNRAVVTATVTGDPGPGAYRLVWQVAGEDGHPMSGESTFTVTAAGAAVAPAPAAPPTPKVTPSYKTPQTQPTTFGHPDHLPGLIVAGVLLLGGVALLLFEHRRRRALVDATEPQDRQPIS